MRSSLNIGYSYHIYNLLQCQSKCEVDGVSVIEDRSLKTIVVFQQVVQQPPFIASTVSTWNNFTSCKSGHQLSCETLTVTNHLMFKGRPEFLSLYILRLTSTSMIWMFIVQMSTYWSNTWNVFWVVFESLFLILSLTFCP